MTVRIATLDRYFTRAKQAALIDVGLQDFEYDTLHRLMIRDTPGRASPGDLARDLEVSGAGHHRPPRRAGEAAASSSAPPPPTTAAGSTSR